MDTTELHTYYAPYDLTDGNHLPHDVCEEHNGEVAVYIKSHADRVINRLIKEKCDLVRENFELKQMIAEDNA